MNTVDPTRPHGDEDPEIVLRWMDDLPKGLCAYAPVPPGGKYSRDRLGRPKFRRVRLRASEPVAQPTRPDGLVADSDWAWITSSPRNWDSITGRLGDNATTIVHALARAGCLTIEHDQHLSKLAQPARRTHPHPKLAGAQAAARENRRTEANSVRSRALSLAETLTDEWPGVAKALRSTTGTDRLIWALRAATDLADGRTHNSVRAFVQEHAEHTKARDDVHHLLAELGFEQEAITAVGLARNPYIGLGGPIRLQTPTGIIDLTGLTGPHDLRLPASQDITLQLPATSPEMIIIENRQAAETICDVRPALPVIWCHGQPPKAVLELIAQAAAQVNTVTVCTDADLGGVRIAARIADHLSPNRQCAIIDIGTADHVVGKSFNAHSRTHLTTLATRADEVGQFAKACLTRGYAIEQEAAAKAALRGALAPAEQYSSSEQQRSQDIE